MKKKRLVRVTSIVLSLLVLAGTITPCTLTAEAASVKKPVKVTGLKKYAVGTNYVHFQWTKIKKNKNTKGYAIYLNGKLYKRVGVKTNRYKIAKLKSNTSYKVSVKAYNTYKQKQYYNSKTKKWQTKKPAKKNWKGKKTRKVTKYAYGSASATLTLKTTKPNGTTPTNNDGANTNPTNNQPVHQHNYNIPIYGEVEDLEQCTVWHCGKCDYEVVSSERMTPEEMDAAGQMLVNHQTHEYDAWCEANYDRLTSDDVYERTAAQQERAWMAENSMHLGGYTTEFISHGWLRHQIIGRKCACGSKQYTISNWRNEEL